MTRCALTTAALLALAGLSVGLGRAADDKPKDKAPPKKSAPAQVAHIRLQGSLEETPGSTDPILGALTENFKGVLDRIDKARKDANVQALVIDLDGLNIGWGKVNELRRALAAFRKSGKKVYAYVESGEAKDYIVGSAGDQVVMPESGWLMLVGTRAEITFYKELLDKLGVKADFLQMGVFKFAAEPFMRASMSKEARKQYNLVLGNFFEEDYVRSIARSRRKLSPERVKQLIDAGPYTATRAAQVGLVDQIAYRDEVVKLVAKDLGREVKLLRDYAKPKAQEIDFSNPFSLLKLLSPSKASIGTRKDRIALIYATGPIVTGKGGSSILGGSSIGSESMIKAIEQADSDPKVRAIVLRVDSPGGSALASDLIWHALMKCKKPVVASMSDVAASGGYYISMGARKVYAEPGTLTGSIGVVGGKLALKGLYDKVGLNTETISHGKNAGILSATNPFSPTERKAMEALMAEVYEQFLARTLQNRARAGKKLTRAELIQLAEGRIWTGRQAHERGLVDALGTLEDAIADAKQLGGLTRDTEVDYLVLPKARSLFETLMESGVSTSLTQRQLGRFAGLAEASHALRDVETLFQLRSEPVWVLLPHGIRLR